ncbi:TonB-dependent receptor domain-containing protein [Novosphingobium tardum]|uniref:TonB-dependent receptor domain-containing protein n=1 Tax=Novosphingobium tardum TaxID=1538021 RepID=A0ABV8RN91_9SPHN
MRTADHLPYLVGASLAAIVASPPALAAEAVLNFTVAPGRLDQAIVAFASQAGLSVVFADPALGARRTAGLRGRYTVRAGLARLLQGTGTRFVFINPRTVRIEREAAAAPVARAAPAAPPAPAPPTVGDVPIIVTASKQGTPLERYPGAVEVVDLGGPAGRGLHRPADSATIVARLPELTSTELGSGRNKLFIRGVADSSFDGSSQSTVGQYLGDARLTYSAPDPDLNLYDITRVEVLAGPQGTLYGTGSLGGIVRLVPAQPDPSGIAASIQAGLSTTRHGAQGNDLAAMFNLPLGSSAALRAVGWRTVAGGYIDNPLLARPDVNRTVTEGGRIALRKTAGPWTIGIGAVVQNINSADGQYTLRGDPALTRSSALLQPFDNDYRLGWAQMSRALGGAALVSTTAIALHDVTSVFDATMPGGPPRKYCEEARITLVTHETRLSGRRHGRHDWVAGISLVLNNEAERRALGDPAAPAPLAGVRNTAAEAALFGEYTVPLGSRIAVTSGARLTLARATGESIGAFAVPGAEFERAHTIVRINPSLALSWTPGGRLVVFARAQQGVRAGGLAVRQDTMPPTVERFSSDTLRMVEAGFRLARPGIDTLALSATAFGARWSKIQADLIDANGLPTTANIGSGRLMGADARLTWRPTPALQIEAGAFLDRSTLDRPAPAYASAQDRDLPNVAEAGGRAAAAYRTALSPTVDLQVDVSGRYVGRSRLGIGAPLDVTQGGYVTGDAGVRLAWGKLGLSLDVTNLGDRRANRFSFGNPFGLAARDQQTPLRPRTIRAGIDARF